MIEKETKQTKPIVTYDTPMMGQTSIQATKAQIQEDVRAYLGRDFADDRLDELCDDIGQIVTDNFENLEN